MTVEHGPHGTASAGQEIELAELLRRLWHGRFLVGACTLVLAAASTGLAFWMTPVYRASIVVVAANSSRTSSLSGSSGSLASLASIAGVDIGASGGPQVQEALAVLRSREFTEGFIVEQRLFADFYPQQWDEARNTWKESEPKHPTLFSAYKRFNALRSIDENKKTGLVTVLIDWKNPAKSADWANELIARLNEVMRKRAIERTDAYLQFLQREFDSTSALETRTAISRLMETQINERMLANVTKEYVFRVVDRALVPDSRDPVRPQKFVLILEGTAFGFVVGIVAVLIRGSVREKRASTVRS